jgi:hypothetical protein
VFGRKHREQKAAAAKEHDRIELLDAVNNLIDLAEGKESSDADWLVLKPRERVVSEVQGCGLFEPRRGPGHWEGRSAGISVPVPDTRLRVRVGKSAGTYIQGAETPTVIDTGNASITTQRVVFQGGKYTREWDFSKLIGVVHYSDHPATAIQVSNREKTSGIVYPGPSPEPLRLAMTVAIALFHGEAEETLRELRDEQAKLQAAAPPAASTGPAPAVSSPAIAPAAVSASAGPAQTKSKDSTPKPTGTPPTMPPPKWGPDPSGRHQFRYWDGATWTEYVSDNGTQSTDPLPPPPSRS